MNPTNFFMEGGLGVVEIIVNKFSETHIYTYSIL